MGYIYFFSLDMHFDRESTVVITKINNLSESVLTNYCQNFGRVVRSYLKSAIQSRNKEPCESIRQRILLIESLLLSIFRCFNQIF